MFSVHFFENKDLVLSQLLENVPSEGEDIKIKGRKGKVSSVINIDEERFHVQVTLDKVNKKKLLLNNDKKKRR